MIMPIPVAAGIPALYELLVGSGLLVGGALTAKQMQKEMDQNPQVIEEALKNVFMGPTKDLINPDILKNIIESKPVTTDQGTTKKEVMETEVSPDDQGMFFASPEVRQFLFKDTPSGMVLGPDAAEIEKKRQEAAPKPLVTPIPPKEETKLETPVLSEADKTKTESFPAQTPEKQILQTPPAKSVDTSILTKEMKAEAPAAPVKFEYPSEEVRNQELNLAKEIFNISDTGASLEQYEKFKNNPIIQNQIERSKKAYNNTSEVEGYGTSEYWEKRKFAGDTVGWKEYLKKYYGEGAPVKNREMFIVMGPSSAGKSSSVVDRLLKDTGSILADSDEVKKTIAEFENGYNASGVHKESSDINARIMKLAASRGDNIVYPTTGREPAKLNALIERAEKFGYTPKVYYVTADRPVLLMRNLGRMLSTNRMVDADTLLTDEVLKDIKTNYEKLPDKYKAGIYDTTPKK
jgi:uncharacterized protein YneF (UPF0154 family)/predicted kinase